MKNKELLINFITSKINKIFNYYNEYNSIIFEFNLPEYTSSPIAESMYFTKSYKQNVNLKHSKKIKTNNFNFSIKYNLYLPTNLLLILIELEQIKQLGKTK